MKEADPNGYEHVTALDDPAKPYKRVWRCPATNTYVKTHAVRREVGFGRLHWDISAALCAGNGEALMHNGKPAIHEELGGLTVQSDAIVDIETAFDRELRFMVAKVERFVLNTQAAARLGGVKVSAPVAPPSLLAL